MQPTKKIKVQRTNRIRLGQATIYCSCEVIREVRDHIIRCNQIFAPKKGESDTLRSALRTLARAKPDHFPQSSKNIIG